jgi:hypothetical protein
MLVVLQEGSKAGGVGLAVGRRQQELVVVVLQAEQQLLIGCG